MTFVQEASIERIRDNGEGPHSALGGRTPDEAHIGFSDGIRLAA